MGYVRIELGGSFVEFVPSTSRGGIFDAEALGHAEALTSAIRWLNEKMPTAIAHDHQLAAQGHRPRLGFGVEDA